MKFLLPVLSFLLVVILPAGSSVVAQEPATTMLSSQAIVANPQTGKVYATDFKAGLVTIFNARTNSVSRVRVGAMPVALALNSAANRIYVANFRGASLSVIDGATDSVVGTLPVGERPFALAVNPATNKIYVSNQFSDTVRIIDGATDAISEFTLGSFNVIAADSKLGKVYLLGYEETDLKVLGDGTISARIPLGMHQWAMAVNESASVLYVTRIGNAELAVIDERTDAISRIPTGKFPCAVQFNSKTSRVYVVNHDDSTVTVVDTAKRTAIATIPVGHRPQGIAIDPTSNRIYVASRNGNTISVIDGAQNRVISTVAVARNPFAIAVLPGTGKVYAATISGEPFAINSGQ